MSSRGLPRDRVRRYHGRMVGHSNRSWARSVGPLHVLVLLGASACGGTTAGGDAGSDGARGVVCGSVTCDVGDVCCNASCGICTAPGGTCTELACTDAGTDGGTVSEDAGVSCGDATCAPGELCCPGCGGVMTCEDGAGCPDVTCAPSCSPTEPCAADEYCEMADGSCGNGICKPRPTGCPRDCPGVCGCDGAEYCNACNARAAGTDVALDGTCAPPACVAMDARGEGTCPGTLGFAFDGTRCVGIHCACAGADCDSLYATSGDCEAAYAHCSGSSTSCGGFVGASCARGEFCDYAPDALCGATDASGTCMPSPTDCAGMPSAPVCGCDGVTYDNACEAHRAGVDDASAGACAPPPDDCRTTGCPSGSTCTNCFGVGWTCLPDGMFCAF